MLNAEMNADAEIRASPLSTSGLQGGEGVGGEQACVRRHASVVASIKGDASVDLHQRLQLSRR